MGNWPSSPKLAALQEETIARSDEFTMNCACKLPRTLTFGRWINKPHIPGQVGQGQPCDRTHPLSIMAKLGEV
jgi:hypothetical protein